MAITAAAPASAGSTQPIVGGPVIAGVCVISPEAILTGSSVGQDANRRLQQLTEAAQQPLKIERAALEKEAHAIQASGAKTSQDQVQQRQRDFSQRLQALQNNAAQRSRELEATRINVVRKISQQAQPLISAAYDAHHCGLLFRRDDLLGGNPTNDLTSEVISALNTKLTSLSFDRESSVTTGGAQ